MQQKNTKTIRVSVTLLDRVRAALSEEMESVVKVQGIPAFMADTMASVIHGKAYSDGESLSKYFTESSNWESDSERESLVLEETETVKSVRVSKAFFNWVNKTYIEWVGDVVALQGHLDEQSAVEIINKSKKRAFTKKLQDMFTHLPSKYANEGSGERLHDDDGLDFT